MIKIDLKKGLASVDGLNLSTRTDPGLIIWLDEQQKELQARIEKEYMLRPCYGITDEGQVGWHCGRSNQIATMLSTAKSLVEKWCVCCPFKKVGHPYECKKDKWEPVYAKPIEPQSGCKGKEQAG